MESKFGKKLYDIVPAVYRSRDIGDLEKYFAACGLPLDQIYATLKQRLADNFPDNPQDGSLACQDWLLPYFAQLLDVRLVSPLVRGKRDEVANAVRWRQGKGTLRIVEEVAQAISQLEVVIHEGWKRVAMTPRLNTPRITATAYGYDQDAPTEYPSLAARHPGLPAMTVDFRCPSGAVSSDESNPAAQTSEVDGYGHVWRQASLHGAPCHPDSFEDVSPRTVDFRSSNWRQGHYHPRKLLLYTVPPAGFFPPNLITVNWTDPLNETFLEHIDVINQGNTTIFRNKTYGSDKFVPVRIRRVIRLGEEGGGGGFADFHNWRFEGLILQNTVELDNGRIELRECAARKVEVHSIDLEKPVITARACLFKTVQAARGLTQLEYCTVLGATISEVINASDCIFLRRIRKGHHPQAAPDNGCIRYSAIVNNQDQGGMRFTEVTRESPVMYSVKYAERGCAVLHSATPVAIRHGAEDGGEMGAYHDEYLSLLQEAVVDKLKDYLPVGLEAVIIPDERLLHLPD